MKASDPYYELVNVFQTMLICLENPCLIFGYQEGELPEVERRYMIQVIKDKMADLFEFLEISFQ